ncbi:TetR/AcrR family transcriptional regulator [Pseudonocardia spinosispora]|uniref:TetR/AcrR family transcriptional regulator n=1 Tax=Pseudonocardia spinosispora TaxID=103441 RepID=UPI0004107818|nr:TetR/AcrR family transcriptional regulator [Pseudonocardia spinosispora]
MAPETSRRPRADAERNRLRILDVARVLFADRGGDVGLPEIARAAGVGMGTVYRHFPSQRDLVEAAAQRRFAEILDFARGSCLRDSPPGRAIATYLRHVGELLDSDRGLSAAIETARGSAGSEPRGDTRAELESAVAALIEHDRAAGTLRADCTVADVYLVVGALSATIRHGDGDWHRLLDLCLAGLGAHTPSA